QQVLDVTGFETDAAQLDAADLGFGTADFVRGVSSGDPFGFPQPAELGTEQHAPYCRAAPRLWLSHIHRCFLPTQWLVKNPFPRDSLPYHVVLMVTRYRLRVRVFRGSMPQSPEKAPRTGRLRFLRLTPLGHPKSTQTNLPPATVGTTPQRRLKQEMSWSPRPVSAIKSGSLRCGIKSLLSRTAQMNSAPRRITLSWMMFSCYFTIRGTACRSALVTSSETTSSTSLAYRTIPHSRRAAIASSRASFTAP